MTFNPKADVSNNRARHRGRNTAIAGGGVIGIGAIVVLLLNMFGYGQFAPLVEGILGEPSAQDPGTEVAKCDTGADANADDHCRIAAVSLNIDDFWGKRMEGYRAPELTVYDGSTSSACGTASNAVGPFYCPADEGIYVDPTFFGILREQFGASAGDLAQLYVVAHEYGHHVQHITGVMREHPDNGSGPGSNGVRIELQADCYAGAWVKSMTEATDANGEPYMLPPTEEQILDALNAAAVVGDDHIQSQSSGQVNPESFTHGSSEQRQRWFAQGYSADVWECDTFAVPAGEL